ncbi:YhcN/YlaJ family sporulation lipoprotein [Thalassobacillus sp. B23F22_16]|uniref:YhcN/YlaJ family sporulation lipoprotein n=1 Tax=Thalassobacillus sp. B23F22_16 TaxID=3459513 RepID=UPI00373F7E6D
MWKQLAAGTFVIAFVLAGCNTQETRQNDQDTNTYDPLETTEQGNSETNKEELRRGAPNKIKREAEEDMRDTTYNISNRAHDNDFYNEKSMEVTRAVSELSEVSVARAIATDGRILVGVVPTPHAKDDHDLKNKVRNKVAEVSDEKDVVIHVNHSDWDEMKDLDARVRAEKAPEKVREEINKFIDRFQLNNDR